VPRVEYGRYGGGLAVSTAAAGLALIRRGRTAILPAPPPAGGHPAVHWGVAKW